MSLQFWLVLMVIAEGIMATSVAFPFTSAQWKELERQAMIYKYMIYSVPVPSDLLLPLTRNLPASALDSSVSRKFLSYQTIIPVFRPFRLTISSFLKLFTMFGTPKMATWSLVDAREQMVKNGGVRKMWLQIRNTASAICIEAALVQESLWKIRPTLMAKAIRKLARNRGIWTIPVFLTLKMIWISRNRIRLLVTGTGSSIM